jgi:diamine N-acetyltransferase
MELTLKPITKENWKGAIELTLKEGQKHFMASNLYSIAEVQFLDQFYAAGIYDGDRMIGFAMFGIDEDDNNYWIYRLMVDQAYQGRGIGAAAVKLIIEEIRSKNTDQIPYIMIGYHPENEGARKTYKKVGFVEKEIAPWGEQLAAFKLVV